MSGAPKRRNLCHAPGTGCSGSEFTLKRADPACDGRGLVQLRNAFVVTCGAVGTHHGMLVSSIFPVEVHLRSPAWRKSLPALPRVLAWSVHHRSDKAPQFDGRKHGGESRVPRQGGVARRDFARRDHVTLGSAGIGIIHLVLVGSGVAAAF